MSDQERLNRSHGQKLRYLRENQETVIDVVLSHDDRIASLERGAKMTNARLSEVEQRNRV